MAPLNYIFLCLAVCAVSLPLVLQAQQAGYEGKLWVYPAIEKSQAAENYYGQLVKDPFRNLENTNNSQTKKWYEAQKTFYNGVINNISGRENLKKEIEKYIYSTNITSDLPREAENGIFYTRNLVKENIQKIIYKDKLTGKRVEVFSTEILNKEGSNFHLDYFEPSLDGKFLAFGVSQGGDEMSVLRVWDVEKQQLLTDSIKHAMYGNPQWLTDGKGFFYNQLKEINSEQDKLDMFEGSKVKLHYLNTDASKDREIFSKTLNANLSLQNIDFPFLYTNPNSQKVVVAIYRGTSPNMLIYSAPLEAIIQPGPAFTAWKSITDTTDEAVAFALWKDNLFVISNKSNPNGSVERINLEKPKEKKVILSSKAKILKTLVLTQNSLYVKYIENGNHHLSHIDIVTLKSQPVKTPAQGTIEIMQSNSIANSYLHSNGLYLLINSWNKDKSIYYYDKDAKNISKTDIYPSGPYSEAPDLIVKKVEVQSHDGETIPLTIIYSDKVKLNGNNPAILYGYGAYGISTDPFYDLSLLAWFNKGGIYAVAHVRGGGEKGKAWYEAGLKSTKSNSWKDFIACAQFLVNAKYTSPRHLAAEAGSAGAITAGRAITERPDLFAAALITYGAVNTMRDEFTSNSIGIAEFGTIKDSVEFNYVYNMDVYQHIKEKQAYPSVMFTAGINDSRVAFWQPAKAAAKMQSVSSGINLILLRLSEEGHRGTASRVEELTDHYSFLLWQLGHPEFSYKSSKNQ